MQIYLFTCRRLRAKTIDFVTESNEPGELMELNKYTISNLQVAYVDLR